MMHEDPTVDMGVPERASQTSIDDKTHHEFRGVEKCIEATGQDPHQQPPRQSPNVRNTSSEWNGWRFLTWQVNQLVLRHDDSKLSANPGMFMTSWCSSSCKAAWCFGSYESCSGVRVHLKSDLFQFRPRRLTLTLTVPVPLAAVLAVCVWGDKTFKLFSCKVGSSHSNTSGSALVDDDPVLDFESLDYFIQLVKHKTVIRGRSVLHCQM